MPIHRFVLFFSQEFIQSNILLRKWRRKYGFLPYRQRNQGLLINFLLPPPQLHLPPPPFPNSTFLPHFPHSPYYLGKRLIDPNTHLIIGKCIELIRDFFLLEKKNIHGLLRKKKLDHMFSLNMVLRRSDLLHR